MCAVAAMAGAPGAWAAERVYVSNSNDNNISAYALGSDGGLAPISGSPFSTGAASEPWGITVSPDATQLFEANGARNVGVYSIASDGSLTQISGSPYPAGNYPLGVALTPDGSHLYATNYTDGTLSAYSVGASGALTPVTRSPFPTGSQPISVAVTPDGRHVYVANYTGPATPGSVSAYSIGADGGLTQLSGSPFATDKGPEALIVSPDGKHLYAANAASTTVSAFSIGADGTLSPVSGSPFPAGNEPIALAITPDGAHLYAANITSRDVSAYSVAADGSLTQVAGSPFGAGTSPEWAAVTPDGHYLYVTNANSHNVSAYTIGASGGLSSVTGSPFAAGNFAVGIAITPDQGPVAAFSAAPALPGRASSFNGSASTDSDGTVARYDWNYGDGSAGANAGPAPTHTYAAPGSYTVTLTVTDDAGCSTTQIFTGQMALCNGGPTARVSRTIVVPPPAISNLRISPRSFALTGRKVKGQCVKPTSANSGQPPCRRAIKLAISYTLNTSAGVRLTLERAVTGRKVKGRCVTQTNKNQMLKECTLLMRLHGAIARLGSAGTNHLVFNGKLGGRALSPGTYRLTATPSAGGRLGIPGSVTFKILP